MNTPSSSLTVIDDSYIDKRRVDMLIKEANAFTMASNMMWCLWSIIQASVSTIEKFGFLEYGIKRLEMYLEQKNKQLKLQEEKPV